MLQRSKTKQLLRNWATAFLVPRPLIGALYLTSYFRDWRRFQQMTSVDKLRWQDSYPCLADKVTATPFDPHYFYQGAWLARRVAEASPSLHVDVASSVLTMSVLSASCRTVFLDYRPLKVTLAGLRSVAGSITQLPFADASLTSLSCLHVIEHIGLGRYGDRLDPDGSRKSAAELMRVLSPNGRLYLSVPIGRERICFNAHRVFSPHTIRAWFTKLELERFSYVGDDCEYVDPAPLEAAERLEYGCGFFEFRRC